MQRSTDWYTTTLFMIGLGVWGWSAINPHDVETWVIEQMATIVGILIVAWLARQVKFSRSNQLALLALFCIHTIGTHYTYSLTPYQALCDYLFGSSPNDWFSWERNHYDRFVHYSYGLLTTRPIEQVLQQRLQLGYSARNFLSLNIILSSSALYELAEWAAAVTIGGDLGTAYLGTQGDVWDAQADIALAGLGWLTWVCVGVLGSTLKYLIGNTQRITKKLV